MLVKIQTDAATVENLMVSDKVLYISTIQPRNPTPKYLLERSKSLHLYLKKMYVNCYSSFTDNPSSLEISQLYFKNKWIHKLVCPHKEILLSNIKELIADPNNPVKKARLRRLYTE